MTNTVSHPKHDQANREKGLVALSSVFAAIGLTSMKLVIGLATGSLGILSEAAHSGLDMAAATVTLLAVRISGRPASERFTGDLSAEANKLATREYRKPFVVPEKV